MLIHPVEHRLFRGVLSAEHLSPARRMVFRTLGGHYGDHRDWKEIDRWAEDIAHRLNTHQARPWP
uniref:Uncharacterized protein n=1 Tax=Streptomyces sp. NBC_00003 TaxID=2903608 RepID=A0AAU2UXM9_9ACTN